MINLLIEGFDEDIPMLKEAKENGDWSKVESLVHKHKGGSQYCGTPRFQKISSYFEDYLKKGGVKQRDLLFEKLIEEMNRIRTER